LSSGLVRGPSLISAFEEMLFSSMPLILAHDSPPIQIFESLMSLNRWKRTSNLPSLVRLCKGYNIRVFYKGYNIGYSMKI
jgi:hypothetical protein